MNSRNKTAPAVLTHAEKAWQCWELRKAGATWQQIADRGIYTNKGSAFAAVMRILDRQNVEMGDDLRKLMGERLDTALLAIWPQVQRGDLPSIDRMLRIEAQRARLFGVEAPVVINGELAVFTISIDRAGALPEDYIDSTVTEITEHTNGNGY